MNAEEIEKEIDTWTRLNECEAVKRIKGDWDYGDTYCNHRGAFGHFPVANGTWDYSNDGWRSAIWIPPLYDPIRPERSLIGIYLELLKQAWLKVFPNSADDKVGFERFASFYLLGAITIDRPDLAVAEAIIEQERE